MRQPSLRQFCFWSPIPIHIKSLTKISRLPSKVVLAALLNLKKIYSENNRGIEIMQLGDSWQFVPKQILWPQLKDRYGKEGSQKLSRAAMETLSIIAYSQPITKNEIEGIRGVSSDSMIRLLMTRELIKVLGRKESLGRPIQYGTTRTFLKVFRLSSISELPKLDEVEQSRFEVRKDE